jgi:cystathionine beta-lyase/cystathionine gamma-synthase
MKFSTRAIHTGSEPDELTGAVNVPLYATSTYANEAFGASKGYDYGRTVNPTRSALERNLAALENGKYCYCFSSGMSAISAVAGLLNAGDHVIVTANVYGGTYRLFEQVYRKFGIDFSWVDTTAEENVRSACRPETRMIFIETPTNPLLSITDIRMISKVAAEYNLISVCDNTFMSPYFQNPLDFGIDIVLHSSTKYIGGHSDIIGGCVVTNSEEISDKIKFIQNSVGAVPSPFDCFLLLRSTKTLALRMERHNENAMRIAAELEKCPKIKKVYYPGLKSHAGHEVAKSQMRGFGGMISVDFSDFSSAVRFFNSVKLFSRAESLGGVESLICHPVSMTHGTVPPEERRKLGLNDGLIRLSVGCEDYDDLIEDISNALSSV